MDHRKLTRRNLKTLRLQILLLVGLIALLAIPGLAQETSRMNATTSSSSSSPQPASDRSKFAVFGNVGVTVPHGDLNIFFDPSFSANVGLEYMITSQFSAEGTLGYHRFSTPSIFHDHANLYQVSGNAKFYLVDESSKVRPFVNGGVGVYVTDAAQAHFGGNVGGGVLYEATPHFGVTAAYNFHAFSAGSNTRFSTVQGGVRWRF